MELFLGFILGLISSLFASYAFAWLAPLLPVSQQKQVKIYILKPRLFFKLLLHTDERQIKDRITSLFMAWTSKNLEDYLSCWAESAVRLYGPSLQAEEFKEDIKRKFTESCRKYSIIKVSNLVFENIQVNSDHVTATANVFYRFELIRADIGLPVIEECREVYVLRKTGGVWSITANRDHARDYEPLALQREPSAIVDPARVNSPAQKPVESTHEQRDTSKGS